MSMGTSEVKLTALCTGAGEPGEECHGWTMQGPYPWSRVGGAVWGDDRTFRRWGLTGSSGLLGKGLSSSPSSLLPEQ